MASKKKPKKTPRKRTPRETSDLVSSLAGQWLRLLRGVKGSRRVGHYERGVPFGMLGDIGTVAELRSVLASALNQDQTRGLRIYANPKDWERTVQTRGRRVKR
jgi:hypothetical protein